MTEKCHCNLSRIVLYQVTNNCWKDNYTYFNILAVDLLYNYNTATHPMAGPMRGQSEPLATHRPHCP